MTTLQIKNIKYISHDALSCGDYSDNGMVGSSNVEVIRENHAEKVLEVWSDLDPQEDYDTNEIEIILIRGNYSSRIVFVREDLFPDYEAKLERYCLLDEDDHSEREYEQACADWADYGAKDFLDALKKKALALYADGDLEAYLDGGFNPDQSVLWSLYNENSNYGSTFEGSSTFFYIEETIEEIAKMDFFHDLLLTAKAHAKKIAKEANDLEAVLFESP